MAMSTGLDPLARDVIDTIPQVPAAQLVLLEELKVPGPIVRAGKHVRVVGVVLDLVLKEEEAAGAGLAQFTLGESTSQNRFGVNCFMHKGPTPLQLKCGDRVEVLGELVPSSELDTDHTFDIRVRVCRSVNGLDMQLHRQSIYVLRSFLTRHNFE